MHSDASGNHVVMLVHDDENNYNVILKAPSCGALDTANFLGHQSNLLEHIPWFSSNITVQTPIDCHQQSKEEKEKFEEVLSFLRYAYPLSKVHHEQAVAVQSSLLVADETDSIRIPINDWTTKSNGRCNHKRGRFGTWKYN